MHILLKEMKPCRGWDLYPDMPIRRQSLFRECDRQVQMNLAMSRRRACRGALEERWGLIDEYECTNRLILGLISNLHVWQTPQNLVVSREISCLES